MDAVLQEEVFGPLGMGSTGFGLDAAGRARLATPYLDTATSMTAPAPVSVPALLGAARECFIERDPGAASMGAATLTSAERLWGKG